MVANENKGNEKLFNNNEYNTIMVGTNGKQSNNEQLELIVNLLVNPANKEVKNEILSTLYKQSESGLEILIKAISNPDYKEHKNVLLSACWESGLDCSKHFSFFVNVAINDDYGSAIEAITIIENTEEILPTEELNSNKQKIEKIIEGSGAKRELLKTLLTIIDSKIKQ